MIKTYSELIKLPTFIDRYRYLRIGGIVGDETFGYDRYLNQVLYQSIEWRKFRNGIIIRDNGCDLAQDGYDIPEGVRILVHHINPITVEDVINRTQKVFDPENVVITTHNTHQAIHYGDENLLFKEPIQRTKYDTCPWRRA